MLEVLVAEGLEDVIEEIKLDPLLVQGEQDRLVIEVRLDAVDRLRAISAEAACWLEWDRLGVIQRPIRVVHRCRWVWRESPDRAVHGPLGDSTSNGCRGAGEGSVADGVAG